MRRRLRQSNIGLLLNQSLMCVAFMVWLVFIGDHFKDFSTIVAPLTEIIKRMLVLSGKRYKNLHLIL